MITTVMAVMAMHHAPPPHSSTRTNICDPTLARNTPPHTCYVYFHLSIHIDVSCLRIFACPVLFSCLFVQCRPSKSFVVTAAAAAAADRSREGKENRKKEVREERHKREVDRESIASTLSACVCVDSFH